MNYNETVDKVMALLKEKEVCSSSQKSHGDCIKNELPRQRCAVWVQYAYQLEEMDSTGTISDRRPYLNRSNYDKLPALMEKRP